MSNTKNILCYVRPWNADQFKYLAEKIEPNSHVVKCSEHVSGDEAGLREGYYRYLKKGKFLAFDDVPEISQNDFQDIILRCRLLRKLSKDSARMHVVAMALSIRDVFAKFKPGSVYSVIVDSYVIDLLRVFSLINRVEFVAFIGTFVNGYYRISSRGDRTFNPDPEINFIEVAKAKLLRSDYVPAFNSKSLSSPRRSVYKRWAANLARIPYFWLKRYLTGDRYNYHYWASQLIAMEQFNLLPPSDPGAASWREKVGAAKKPSIFIPLQMFPECTVDYWCQNVNMIKYYEALDCVIDSLSKDFHLVLKEHPSVMGSRPANFYSQLKKDHRVTVVPTYTSSNEVLGKVDSVLVWTGTVGFEAILRGIAVFGLATPYYAYGDRFIDVSESLDVFEMTRHIERCKLNPITVTEQEELLGFLGKQLYKGNFTNDGTWSLDKVEHILDSECMVESFQKGKAV